MQKNIRKITKDKRNNYYINVPKNVIRKLKWQEHQKVTVENIGRHIVIKDWPSKKK